MHQVNKWLHLNKNILSNVPIIALSQYKSIVGQMTLLWGVYPFLVNTVFKFQEYITYSETIVKKLKLAKKNDFIIILSGLTDESAGTNSIVIHKVGG